MTVESVLDRQAVARERIAAQVTRVLEQSWRGLGSWDRVDVERFTAQILPIIRAGQTQTAAVTNVFIASVLSEMTGGAVSPVGVADVVDLRPTPPDEVYARPFVATWTALANGAARDAALSIGLDRLRRLADDDLSLAHRRASLRALGADSRVQGYRRVIRPELARGGTCGLCVAASDQRYGSADLMPIHTRCRCEVAPILDGADPGREINGADIRSLYRDAKRLGTSREELSRARYVVRDHGELGPVLQRAGDSFTGPGDLVAAA